MSLSGRDEIDWDPNKPGGVPDFASHPPEASRLEFEKAEEKFHARLSFGFAATGP
jgi:hypothetical protein